MEGGLGGFAAGGMASFLMATRYRRPGPGVLTILRSFTFNTQLALDTI